MTMTKKDYEFLSGIIFEHIKRTDGHYSSTSAQVALVRLAEDLADELEKINPQFKRNRFLLDCGVAQRRVH